MKEIMKKVKRIKNKLTKRQKISILVLGSCLLISILALGLRGSIGSTESGYLSNQTVSGLSFENASIEVANGISRYKVEVINDSGNEYPLKNISIVFKNVSGGEITTLLGYIGESLDKDEAKIMDASIDMEITDIGSIEYIINK